MANTDDLNKKKTAADQKLKDAQVAETAAKRDSDADAAQVTTDSAADAATQQGDADQVTASTQRLKDAQALVTSASAEEVLAAADLAESLAADADSKLADALANQTKLKADPATAAADLATADAAVTTAQTNAGKAHSDAISARALANALPAPVAVTAPADADAATQDAFLNQQAAQKNLDDLNSQVQGATDLVAADQKDPAVDAATRADHVKALTLLQARADAAAQSFSDAQTAYQIAQANAAAAAAEKTAREKDLAAQSAAAAAASLKNSTNATAKAKADSDSSAAMQDAFAADTAAMTLRMKSNQLIMSQSKVLSQASARPPANPYSLVGGTATPPVAAMALDAASTTAALKIVKDAGMTQDESQYMHAVNLIAAFADQVSQGMTVGKSTALAAVEMKIKAIDEMISDRMDQILHDRNFQELEASWLGLHYLVKNTETNEMLKLRLLNATKKELSDDFEKASDFDQSVLFKKVYEEEYGTFGGNPFSVLVGDFYFDRSPGDMALLTSISNVAAAAHAPFLSAADPKLFDMTSFSELSKPRDLAKQFDSTEMIKWRSFRDSEDSRYVALSLPHVLMRYPYGANFTAVEGFDYTEDVSGRTTEKFLWGNAAYALAQRITNAFSLYQWCAAIRGVEGGGLVEDLPVYTFKADDGDMAFTCPTEIAITDRRENELTKLGFIALCHQKGSDKAAFFGGQTTNKPKTYDLDEANANAALSARLPYILATSRFAHYIKVMMRDKIGSFMTKENVSTYLNQWLATKILLNDDAPQAVKAAYPLREGRIDVFDIPGKPGSYTAVAYLKPHFQLEELTMSLRLVAELPAPAK